MGMFDRNADPRVAAALARTQLHGDVPADQWRADGQDFTSERFKAATGARKRGQLNESIRILRALANDPNLEARDQLQVWSALRALGVPAPPNLCGRVLGVVLDVPVGAGLDTLAAYADGSARYVSHSGGIGVLEAGPSPFLDLVDDVVDRGQALSPHVPLWTAPRTPVPAGYARLSLLSPDGLRFGEGAGQHFQLDHAAAPIFAAGARLLHRLSERAAEQQA